VLDSYANLYYYYQLIRNQNQNQNQKQEIFMEDPKFVEADLLACGIWYPLVLALVPLLVECVIPMAVA